MPDLSAPMTAFSVIRGPRMIFLFSSTFSLAIYLWKSFYRVFRIHDSNILVFQQVYNIHVSCFANLEIVEVAETLFYIGIFLGERQENSVVFLLGSFVEERAHYLFSKFGLDRRQRQFTNENNFTFLELAG